MTNLFKDFHRLCALESQIQAQDFTLKAENAALKEQVAQWETEYNGCSTLLNNAERTIETLEETITQQADRIVELNKECNSHYETCQQQAEAIRLKDEALIAVRDDLELRMRIAEDDSLNISNSVLDQMCDAIAIQPYPEILQARDKRIVAACAQYVYEMGGTKGSVLLAEMMLSGEWRKYL